MPRDPAARDRRRDLGEYLRARRSALTPTDVGLVPGGRRRTPGLRREEVALLAGVSVSWYTWLEQGRPVNASADVLDAVARALRLDPVERTHLHRLAGQPSPPPVTPDRAWPGRADAGGSPTGDGDGLPVVADLAPLLAALEPHPAFVLGPRWDILAWNDAQARLFPPLASLPAGDRNLVWLVFTDPAVRSLIVDGESEARRVLSQFRAETVPWRHDPAWVALVERLVAASPEFASWWPRHDVAGFESRTRTFAHPQAGTLRFAYQQLIPAGQPDLRVVAHLPLPGDDSAERLARCGA